jgi:hypothetical protein
MDHVERRQRALAADAARLYGPTQGFYHIG